MGIFPLLWEYSHFYGNYPIVMGIFPFLWENEECLSKAMCSTIYEKFPFLWECSHFYGNMSNFMGK
jgi:hypothetical protein